MKINSRKSYKYNKTENNKQKATIKLTTISDSKNVNDINQREQKI